MSIIKRKQLMISRRAIVKHGAISLVGLNSFSALAALTGCGGASNGEGGMSSDTRMQNFKVLPGEVGGSGLVLRTPFADPKLLEFGEANSLIGAGKTHLISIVDESGALRALGYAGKGSETTSVIIDAESTSIALLLLCVGVTVTNSTQSEACIANLRSKTTFGRLVSRVQELLPAQTVTEVTKDPDFQNRLIAVLQQYWDSVRSSRGIEPDLLTYGVEGNVFESNEMSSVTLELRHHKWRLAKLYRRDISTGGNDTRTIGEYSNYLESLDSVSLGDLLRAPATLVAPSVFRDPVKVNFTEASEARYYILGPGLAANDLRPEHPLPSEITEDDVAWVYAVNFIVLLVLPVLDLCGLGLEFTDFKKIGKAVAGAQELLSLLFQQDLSGELAESVSKLGKASWAYVDMRGDEVELLAAAVDVMESLLSAAAAYVQLLGKDLVINGIKLIDAKKLLRQGPLLVGTAAIMATGNLFLAFHSWRDTPAVFSFSFVAKGDGTIIIS